MQPGEVEHTLGDDFATVHIGKGDKIARDRDINRTAENGASRPRKRTVWPLWSLAASARLMASAGMSSSAVSTGRSASARFPSPAAALSHKAASCSSEIIATSPKGPTEVRRKAETWPKQPKTPAHIAGQGPDIGAFAAFGLEHGMVGIGAFDEIERADIDQAALQHDLLAVAGEVIGALAFDLDGGIARRDLLDRAGELREQRTRPHPGRAATALVSTTRPSASSVSRSSPQRTVKR